MASSALCVVSAAASQEPEQPPNLLLLIADDIGVDRVAAYGEHPSPGNTPVLDSLAAQGVLFRNAYSNPSCSPSRGIMMSGRFAFRTGWGLGTNSGGTPVEYPLAELALPELLPDGYSTAAIGKWHLASVLLTGALHPNLTGFDEFWGTPDNFSPPQGYFDWFVGENGGEPVQTTTYATTAVVDRTLLMTQTLQEPWFIWTAFHAAHGPFHKPPQELHSFDLPDQVSTSIPLHVKAMIEALDTEIGRLLESMDPDVLANTVVVFVADNGTGDVATTEPFLPSHAKSTVFEGGINVPLIVSGPGVVQGAECQALVSIADLFATLGELAGVPNINAEDSVSLVPYLADPSLPSIRPHVYSEWFEPNGFAAFETRYRAVRNERYKLIHQHRNASTIPDFVHFFDLLDDPFEETDLMGTQLTVEQQTNLDLLAAVLFEPYVPFQPASWPLPGTNGDPLLTGSGPAVPGQPFALHLTNALENAPAWLVIGTKHLSTFFAGGVLAPNPVYVLARLTDATGSTSNTFTWPEGVMPGTTFAVVQYWIADPGAAEGLAATSGLALSVP